MGAFFGQREWGRLLTAMLTPFDSDGNVNLREAAKIARYCVDVQKNDLHVVSSSGMISTSSL